MKKAELLALAERVEALTQPDNAVDVLCEVALFDSAGQGGQYISIRPNAAGTKVIATHWDGSEVTGWAWDWTLAHNRKETAAALLARAERGE